MIVVTTPTGHNGSQIIPHLLAAGESVRLIARDPSKLPAGLRADANVDIVQGSADDPAVVDKAFAGAECVFWVVPPSFTTPDIRKYYLDYSRPAVSALKKHGVQRVVSVSSLGRHLGMKAGAISASHAKDELFETSGVAYRGLWAPGFMDNLLMQIQLLKTAGMYVWPTDGGKKLPQAATRDIAASGARLLLNKSWSGTGGLAVMGPENLSSNDMAAIMTDVLGKPIRFQRVSSEHYKAELLGHGASEAMADGLVEMFKAVDAGLYDAEPRTKENTTPTSFRTWCEEVLRPAFAG